MTNKPIYINSHDDKTWGCEYFEVNTNTSTKKIKVCHVKVYDINKIAEELTKNVLDTSWMTTLDKLSFKAYNKTVHDTAKILVDIFQATAASTNVGSEFGELMVSIGSAKALETIFNHYILPIAELWKPQRKQNEGFDFHTVCPSQIINFGEAKYSGSSNPHGNAIEQAKGFIEDEKHFRDSVHLINLVPHPAIENLENDSYGIIAAFSINSADPLQILKNAIESAQSSLGKEQIKSVYLVGVSK